MKALATTAMLNPRKLPRHKEITRFSFLTLDSVPMRSSSATTWGYVVERKDRPIATAARCMATRAATTSWLKMFPGMDELRSTERMSRCARVNVTLDP